MSYSSGEAKSKVKRAHIWRGSSESIIPWVKVIEQESMCEIGGRKETKFSIKWILFLYEPSSSIAVHDDRNL